MPQVFALLMEQDDSELQKLSARRVRRLLEEKFGMERESLDA